MKTVISFLSRKTHGYMALTVYLLVIASAFISFQFPDFSGSVNESQALVLTLLTDSAGSPYFLITTAVLCLLPLVFRLPKKAVATIWMQFGLLLVLSFVAKTGLKQLTEVPRPYTCELQQLGLVSSPQAFYRLDDQEKGAVVELAASSVSAWRLDKWQGETNYSLPSGHSIFAAICVVFWGGFFLRRRMVLPFVILVGWATGVGFSRVWLGMHWPSDVIASIVCAAILYLFIPEVGMKRELPEKKQYILKTG